MAVRHIFFLIVILIATKHILMNNYNDSIIFKERSQIFFYPERYVITYSLDISNFVENTRFMEESISNIQSICQTKHNRFINKCEHFLDITKYNTRSIKNDINLMKDGKKSKRSLINKIKKPLAGIGKIFSKVITSSIISGAIAYSQAHKVDKKLMLLSKRNKNISRLQSNLTEQSLNVYKNIMTEMYREIQNLENYQYTIMKELESGKIINNYIHNAILAIVQHNRETQQWKDIINGNTKAHVFNFFSSTHFFKRFRKYAKKGKL